MMRTVMRLCLLLSAVSSFQLQYPRQGATTDRIQTRHRSGVFHVDNVPLFSKSFSLHASSSFDDDDDGPSTTTTIPLSASTVNDIKGRLLRICSRPTKPSASEVVPLIDELEAEAEMVGIGQGSSISGLLAGEWELVYASTDVTRSSPFFWAFRKAFPDTADQIYDLTDSIPSPLKDVGPAIQQIDLNGGGTQTGRFVSKVQVTTLGGLASSIMTTRGTITGFDGIDGIKIKIETTKPEKSTAIATLLGPFGDVINENLPPFPSGDALERVVPGSSEIVLRTTFCDESLRISRNNERLDSEFFVWKRREFASYDFL